MKADDISSVVTQMLWEWKYSAFYTTPS